MALFNVSYEIVTPESAEQGDVAERDFVVKAVRLKDAFREVFATRAASGAGVECVECDSYPCSAPRWVTVSNGTEVETGAQESRTLHIPLTVTDSSARRIARLMGAPL